MCVCVCERDREGGYVCEGERVLLALLLPLTRDRPPSRAGVKVFHWYYEPSRLAPREDERARQRERRRERNRARKTERESET